MTPVSFLLSATLLAGYCSFHQICCFRLDLLGFSRAPGCISGDLQAKWHSVVVSQWAISGVLGALTLPRASFTSRDASSLAINVWRSALWKRVFASLLARSRRPRRSGGRPTGCGARRGRWFLPRAWPVAGVSATSPSLSSETSPADSWLSVPSSTIADASMKHSVRAGRPPFRSNLYSKAILRWPVHERCDVRQPSALPTTLKIQVSNTCEPGASNMRLIPPRVFLPVNQDLDDRGASKSPKTLESTLYSPPRSRALAPLRPPSQARVDSAFGRPGGGPHAIDTRYMWGSIYYMMSK